MGLLRPVNRPSRLRLVLREFEGIHDKGKSSLRAAMGRRANAATGSVILTKAPCKPYRRAVAHAPIAALSGHIGN